MMLSSFGSRSSSSSSPSSLLAPISSSTTTPLAVTLNPCTAGNNNMTTSPLSLKNLCDEAPSPTNTHQRTTSSMSSVPPPSEEDVQLAVEALGGLKYQTPVAATSTDSSFTLDQHNPHLYSHQSHSHLSSSATHIGDPLQNHHEISHQSAYAVPQDISQIHRLPPISPSDPRMDPNQTPAFFSRVSNIIPLVNRSIHQISTAYEATKNVSKVVKYSAESVETGVKTITKPVFDTLEPALAPLDRFACNQLDKLEKSFPYIIGGAQSSPAPDSTSPPCPVQHMQNVDTLRRRHRTTSKDILAPPKIPLSTDGSSSNSTSSHNEHSHSIAHGGQHTFFPPQYNGNEHVNDNIRTNKTGWQSVVAGVGANLGMISDDTIRGLRYCLQYIHYAIQKVEERIMILKSALAEATSHATQMITTSPGNVDADTNRIVGLVTSVKKEIVDMIRSVVDMVGKQAAAYLPGDARQSVRGFILSLPSRLTMLVRRGNDPALPQNPATSETQNVLTFATESSNMLRGIESVFSETVTGAEKALASKIGHSQFVPSSSTSMSPIREIPMDVSVSCSNSSYPSEPMTNNLETTSSSYGNPAMTPRKRQISTSKRMRTSSSEESYSMETD